MILLFGLVNGATLCYLVLFVEVCFVLCKPKNLPLFYNNQRQRNPNSNPDLSTPTLLQSLIKHGRVLSSSQLQTKTKTIRF